MTSHLPNEPRSMQNPICKRTVTKIVKRANLDGRSCPRKKRSPYPTDRTRLGLRPES